MNLREFYDYKTQLLKDLLTDDNVLELLDAEVEYSDPKELVYKVVFPYEYIPDTVEYGHTFICCDVDVQVPNVRTLKDTQLFYTPILYIWIFTHKSKMQVPGGGVRPDEICAAIADKINGSFFYGLGELQLYSAKRFAPVIDFQGKVLAFTMKEFNHTNDRTKPIPSNRKKGI